MHACYYLRPVLPILPNLQHTHKQVQGGHQKIVGHSTVHTHFYTTHVRLRAYSHLFEWCAGCIGRGGRDVAIGDDITTTTQTVAALRVRGKVLLNDSLRGKLSHRHRDDWKRGRGRGREREREGKGGTEREWVICTPNIIAIRNSNSMTATYILLCTFASHTNILNALHINP